MLSLRYPRRNYRNFEGFLNKNRCLQSIYDTAGMDISAGSVPPGPHLTGGMEPGMNTNI